MASVRLAKHYEVSDREGEPVRVVETDVVVLDGVFVREVPRENVRNDPFRDLTSCWHDTPGKAVDEWRKTPRAQYRTLMDSAIVIEDRLRVENGRIEIEPRPVTDVVNT